jgi:hypothetical protein
MWDRSSKPGWVWEYIGIQTGNKLRRISYSLAVKKSVVEIAGLIIWDLGLDASRIVEVWMPRLHR